MQTTSQARLSQGCHKITTANRPSSRPSPRRQAVQQRTPPRPCRHDLRRHALKAMPRLTHENAALRNPPISDGRMLVRWLARAWRAFFARLTAIRRHGEAIAGFSAAFCAYTRATRRHSRGPPSRARRFRAKWVYIRRCKIYLPHNATMRASGKASTHKMGRQPARELLSSSTETDNYRHTPLGVPVVVDS